MAFIVTSTLATLSSGIGAYEGGKRQANAQNQATLAQEGMFNTVQNEQAPWRQAGQTSLNALMYGFGEPGTGSGQGGSTTNPAGMTSGQFAHQFNASDLKTNLAPNYQFMLDQGIGATKNLENQAGGALSGNAIRAIDRYSQNYAGNAYQQAFQNYNTNQTNIYNRLAGIAGLGQQAGSASTTGAPAFSSGIASTI